MEERRISHRVFKGLPSVKASGSGVVYPDLAQMLQTWSHQVELVSVVAVELLVLTGHQDELVTGVRAALHITHHLHLNCGGQEELPPRVQVCSVALGVIQDPHG